MSLLLNMLSRLVITFLPRSKRLLISWLQSPSAVILEPQETTFDTVCTVSHEVMGPDAMILFFWMLSFKPTFLLSSFTFIKRLLSFSSLSAVRVVSSHIWCWEGLGAGEEGDYRGWEGDDRGWDGWMASLTGWTWVWVNSRSWWWTGRPGMLWFMGSQRVGRDWVTELNWLKVGLEYLRIIFQAIALLLWLE